MNVQVRRATRGRELHDHHALVVISRHVDRELVLQPSAVTFPLVVEPVHPRVALETHLRRYVAEKQRGQLTTRESSSSYAVR